MLAPVGHALAAQVTYAGVVTRVVDGDTVWLKTPALGQPLKVRLSGIDAPEICQTGGVQARDALVGRVLGQQVTLKSRAHDDYGRTLGTVYLNGQDINRWLVTNGHAWVYRFRQKKPLYSEDFAQARAARRGLFSDVEALDPRAFRKAYGSCPDTKKRPSSYR